MWLTLAKEEVQAACHDLCGSAPSETDENRFWRRLQVLKSEFLRRPQIASVRELYQSLKAPVSIDSRSKPELARLVALRRIAALRTVAAVNGLDSDWVRVRDRKDDPVATEAWQRHQMDARAASSGSVMPVKARNRVGAIAESLARGDVREAVKNLEELVPHPLAVPRGMLEKVLDPYIVKLSEWHDTERHVWSAPIATLFAQFALNIGDPRYITSATTDMLSRVAATQHHAVSRVAGESAFALAVEAAQRQNSAEMQMASGMELDAFRQYNRHYLLHAVGKPTDPDSFLEFCRHRFGERSLSLASGWRCFACSQVHSRQFDKAKKALDELDGILDADNYLGAVNNLAMRYYALLIRAEALHRARTESLIVNELTAIIRVLDNLKQVYDDYKHIEDTQGLKKGDEYIPPVNRAAMFYLLWLYVDQEARVRAAYLELAVLETLGSDESGCIQIARRLAEDLLAVKELPSRYGLLLRRKLAS